MPGCAAPPHSLACSPATGRWTRPTGARCRRRKQMQQWHCCRLLLPPGWNHRGPARMQKAKESTLFQPCCWKKQCVTARRRNRCAGTAAAEDICMNEVGTATLSGLTMVARVSMQAAQAASAPVSRALCAANCRDAHDVGMCQHQFALRAQLTRGLTHLHHVTFMRHHRRCSVRAVGTSGAAAGCAAG